jgi:hypothetical protein
MLGCGGRSQHKAGRRLIGAAAFALTIAYGVTIAEAFEIDGAGIYHPSADDEALNAGQNPTAAAPREEAEAKPGYYESRCKEPQSTDDADLCQQWRMANATEELRALADRQLWATYSEIGALVTSLVFTAIAAAAAAVAAWKAAEANRLSRENAIADRRAWLAISSLVLLKPLSRAGDNIVTEVAFTCENIGRSPAIDVASDVKIVPLLIGHPIDEFYSTFRKQLISRSGLGVSVFPEKVDGSTISTHISNTDAIAGATGSNTVLLGVYYGVCYRLADGGPLHTTINIWQLSPIRLDADRPTGGFAALGFHNPGVVFKGYAD